MVRVSAQDRDLAAWVGSRSFQDHIPERATGEPGEPAVICGATAIPTHLGERGHVRQDNHPLESSSCLVELWFELASGTFAQLHEFALQLRPILKHSEGIVDARGALQIQD